jgi:hypothetical protein
MSPFILGLIPVLLFDIASADSVDFLVFIVVLVVVVTLIYIYNSAYLFLKPDEEK